MWVAIYKVPESVLIFNLVLSYSAGRKNVGGGAPLELSYQPRMMVF